VPFRPLTTAAAVLVAAGCGTYPGAPGTERAVEHRLEVAEPEPSAGAEVTVEEAPAEPGVRTRRADVLVAQEVPHRSRVVVVPEYAEGAPRVSAPPPPEPAPPRRRRVEHDGDGPVRCSGNERVELSERRVVSEDGPAVVATGNCAVTISESIVRGEGAAVVVRGNARVTLVECRIYGDLVSGGNGRVVTRGSEHHGRAVARQRSEPPYPG